MKKFFLKISVIGLFFTGILLLKMHYDTFNVFHWQNIRFTSAQPNENFVKTQYIVHNPQKFNAFIFGSSRVGQLPAEALPKEADGIPLSWYNMTYPGGIPAEHSQTIRTLLKNGVGIRMVLLGFDNIAMFASIEQHKKELLKMPFQMYEESPLRFYAPYLRNIPSPSIVREISRYKAAEKREETELFYEYGGWTGCPTDFSLTENPQMERYESEHFGYSQKEAHKDIEEIISLCSEHGIRLVLLTNPMYQTLYRNSVEDGYFDFLRSVAQKCEFYNFSALNNYTTNPRYFFEWSHYRPALGLLVEKALFGTDEEREGIRREAGDALWGARVSAGNVEEIIAHLRRQIDDRN